MAITLNEIANAAKVSMMTVSRALHNRSGVSAGVKQRVVELAERMGYVPGRMSGLAGTQTRSMTIGVVIPQVEHTFFPAVINFIERTMSENGYNLFLCCSYGNTIKEHHDISALLERRVDGIIWCPAAMEESMRTANIIIKEHCPMVFFDRLIPEVNADAVIVDDYNGALAAVAHLLNNGYRKITHLTTTKTSWVSNERERGFVDAMRKYNLTPTARNIIRVGDDMSAGEHAVSQLLLRKNHPEALFCFNDPLAVGAFKVLQRHKIRIPEDMALVGFSGTTETEIAATPITTVYQDAATLGRQAALTLLSRMRLPELDIPPRRIVLNTSLIIRASSQPAINR